MTDIYKASPADLDDIARLEQACFSVPWSEGQVLSEIKSEDACVICAVNDGVVCGFCIAHLVGDDAEVYQIAVDEPYRRRGIGELMLSYAMTQMEDMGALALYLEVRVSNKPAIALYESFGFERVGIRKKYYTAPTEDAMIMKRVIE